MGRRAKSRAGICRLIRNPAAGQRLCRMAGLIPDTSQRRSAAKRKSENDFGHDVLLPAHACHRRERTWAQRGPRLRRKRSWPDSWFQEGWVGAAVIPGGFCSLTQTIVVHCEERAGSSNRPDRPAQRRRALQPVRSARAPLPATCHRCIVEVLELLRFS